MVDQPQHSSDHDPHTAPAPTQIVAGGGLTSAASGTKNALTCPNCGEPTGLGDRACKRCGHDLTVQDSDETKLRADVVVPLVCPNCGLDYSPGKLICSRCGLAFDHRHQTKMREAAGTLNCPRCGRACQPGERFCLACGHFLQVDPEDTSDFSSQLATKQSLDQPFPGPLPTSEEIPIIFEIEGAHLILPAGNLLVVGRRSNRHNDSQPDVDLGAFGAHDKGVSRRHIMIKRRGTLAYVADIGSANGTWLNGHHLMLNGERLLRHGDELQLSHLKVKILYSL
jgi:FHA domain-containing protein/double zinc ribbon protein